MPVRGGRPYAVLFYFVSSAEGESIVIYPLFVTMKASRWASIRDLSIHSMAMWVFSWWMWDTKQISEEENGYECDGECDGEIQPEPEEMCRECDA